MESVEDLVRRLAVAADAYYNGKPLHMTDAEFDAAMDTLRSLAPTHAFLRQVGAPVDNGVRLPAPMASLDKIKPGQPSLAKFLAVPKPLVLSEKLDGLSALWCPNTRSLYLRGDGIIGVAINQQAKHIRGLVASDAPWIIRGELILPRTDPEPSRSIVNGILHQKDASAAMLARIHFVAYEVLQPTQLTRSQQFRWLREHGFAVPWWTVETSMTEAALQSVFAERRAASAYETDGIVVGVDQVPIAFTAAVAKNPKDCVAFKMVVADQTAETTVQEIQWNPSSQGYLIPRIRFTPVQIGGATIEYCTGHNAKTIAAGNLGPQAVIRIRRSGDVIPTLDAIVSPATTWSQPPPGTWEWIGNEQDAVHIRQTGGSAAQTISQLHHFAKTLDIPGLGPGSCKTLVEAGICGPAQLYAATECRLCAVLGPKTGKTLYAAFRKATEAATEVVYMVASSKMPRGVGETKLGALSESSPDPRSWATATLPGHAWTQDSFRDFQTVYPAYEVWRQRELHWIPYPRLSVAPPKPTGPTVCMTGFRDAALEKRIVEAGMTVSATLTAAVSILIIAETSSTSSKIVKARSSPGITILPRAEFTAKYLGQQ
jgi:DNA ligase (NAD+)